MNVKEKELVTEEFCKREDTYNICEGGKGGFGYLNSIEFNNISHSPEHMKMMAEKRAKLVKDSEFKAKIINAAKLGGAKTALIIKGMTRDQRIEKYGGHPGFHGKRHSEKTKKLMSKSAPKRYGQDNPAYGTMWITNGEVNKKIKKEEIIPEGFRKGKINIKIR